MVVFSSGCAATLFKTAVWLWREHKKINKQKISGDWKSQLVDDVQWAEPWSSLWKKEKGKSPCEKIKKKKKIGKKNKIKGVHIV